MLFRSGDLRSDQTRKNRLTLRGAVGVWNCESSDYIKGCDGTCIHAIGSLAGAGGWSLTNVAAFSISSDSEPFHDFQHRACITAENKTCSTRFMQVSGDNLLYFSIPGDCMSRVRCRRDSLERTIRQISALFAPATIQPCHNFLPTNRVEITVNTQEM